MQAKISYITLAVNDLDRSVAFYRDGLGWQTEGIVGQEFHDEVTGADGTIAFFVLDGGLLLGLYARANLAKDAGVPPGHFAGRCRRAAPAGRDGRWHANSARSYAPFRRLLRVLHRSRRSPLRDRLELQRIERGPNYVKPTSSLK
jgi:catechol 2,3-dioxygenase-like lactoylglutathione lyase family enzyme